MKSEKNDSYTKYYNLEIDNLIKEINKNSYQKVLLQFPDGLKRFAKNIIDDLKLETKASYYIYFGTCYGGCDIPLHLTNMKFNLCVQWGHTNYIKKENIW